MRKLFCLFTEVCYNVIAYAEEDAYGILHAQPERNGGCRRPPWLRTLSRLRCCLFWRTGHGKNRVYPRACRGLGYQGRVTSPTFTIVNEYEGGRLPLFHFDMYRLTSAEDLFDIGWEDFLRRGGVCAVEWSETIQEALEPDTIYVDIRRGAETNQRILTIRGPGW